MAPRNGRRGGWSGRAALAGGLLALLAATGSGRGHEADPRAEWVARIVRMSRDELDGLYRRCSPGPAPEGRVRGRALVAPGRAFGPALSGAARVVWQGKVFEPGGTMAVNRFVGLKVVRARVYAGASWVDGGPTLVLDYSRTSRVYARYRDEVRQVMPGLYLGVMHDRTTPTPKVKMYFVLSARP